MDHLFQDLSEKSLKHVPVLGLFAGFIRTPLLAHFAGPESDRCELYKELTGECLSVEEWEEVLEQRSTRNAGMCSTPDSRTSSFRCL